MILWATLSAEENALEPPRPDREALINSLKQHEKNLCQKAYVRDPIQKALFVSAGQFVIERLVDDKTTPTILAGYPWFLDWGRDTFIALPGLCLSTERFDTAAGVLQTFAAAVSEGMVPNRLTITEDRPITTASMPPLVYPFGFAWLRCSGDDVSFTKTLLPAIREILTAYHDGTRFGIRADQDGLITGGDQETQLTWMDAKYGRQFYPGTARQSKSTPSGTAPCVIWPTIIPTVRSGI